jgi:hypothetical protein
MLSKRLINSAISVANKCSRASSRLVANEHGSRKQGSHNYNSGHENGGGEQFSRGYYVPVALALGFIIDYNVKSHTADSCGIVGVVGGEDASGFLLEGLTILRNRGYDSAGVASVPSDGALLSITKYASRDTTADSIDLVRANVSKHAGHHTGIAHTRWATHGGKNLSFIAALVWCSWRGWHR